MFSILILYRESINWKSFFVWIFAQCSVLQFWTPNCLKSFGCGTPNGALWTVGVMVQSYIVIWLLYRVLHKRTIKRWGIIILLGISINLITPMIQNFIPSILYKLVLQTFLPYIWMFILGAFLSEYFDEIVDTLKAYWILFFIVSIIVSVTKFDAGIYRTLKVLFLAPAVIGFAYKYDMLNFKYDISYGIYIYHMVVINIMIELGMTGNILDAILAFFVSMIVAVISYNSIGRLSRNMRKQLI